jgi:flagellar biosynthesis anti-sigma factor FlgM
MSVSQVTNGSALAALNTVDSTTSVSGTKALEGSTKSASYAENSSAANGAPQHGDKAVFSAAGASVLETSQDTGVRAQKIAALQAAINDGSYAVPSGAVADKIIQSLLR